MPGVCCHAISVDVTPAVAGTASGADVLLEESIRSVPCAPALVPRTAANSWWD